MNIKLRKQRERSEDDSTSNRKLAGQLDSEHLGGLELPGETSHHIDGISTSNTNAEASETATVGRVRVGSNGEETGVRIVLEDDLVDDAAAWLPETNAELGASARKEVINLKVCQMRCRNSCHEEQRKPH